MAPESVVEYVRDLPRAVHAVIVDRDGTTGFAVAGLVTAQLPERAVRVLAGGTTRFWQEIETSTQGATPTPGSASRPAAAPPAPSAPAPKKQPKRRSAGC
jgi:hypothetical protein